jgi:hypothetical protein
MKSIQALFAGAFALAIAASAQAQTTYYLTGSTAYRSQTVTAIYNLMNVNAGTNPITIAYAKNYNPATGTYSDKLVTGANAAILSGAITINGVVTPVILDLSWSGSAAGVFSVSATPQGTSPQVLTPYLPDGTTLVAGNLTSGGNALSDDPTRQDGADPSSGHVAQIAMSDVFQAATPFATGTLITSASNPAYTYKAAALTDNVVGVVPFVFVAGNGAPAGLNNITPQLAQGLWASATGTESLQLFTGLATDAGTLVYATGRNPDSGTRITAFAETGVGTSTTTQQYYPTVSSGAVTGYNLFPATTLFNVLSVAAGNNGESSGGNLVNDLTPTESASTGFLVGYLGTSDATSALKGGAVELAYNGFTLPNSGSPNYTFSNFSLVQNGPYTYWGYEHLDYLKSASTAVKNLGTTIAKQIHDVTAAVLVTSMNVGRTSDGGQISLGNPY